MSNTIRLKRSSVAAKVPLLADLTDGELALNSTDGRIYYRHSSGTNVAEIKAGEVTNGVYTVGNQTVGGVKNFSSNVGIGTASPVEALDVVGNVKVSGHFSAATKSFRIPHQSKDGYLQYGVVESNEHGVYVRGKTSQETILLPEHWDWLVDENSVTVQVTPIGKSMNLYVEQQNNLSVKIGGVQGFYNYTIYGTRKDVESLIVEAKQLETEF